MNCSVEVILKNYLTRKEMDMKKSMKKIQRLSILAVFVAPLMLSSNSVNAGTVLLSTGNGTGGYGYGFSSWGNFTAALDTATGNQVTTTGNFNNLTQMLSYDSLFLDQRWTGGSLSSTEVSNITSYIGTGRRVVMMGENSSWTSWNNQVLGIVGGSFAGNASSSTSASVSNEITNGAPELSLPGAGSANGGTALYDQNFATLWGLNVLTVLDVNVWQDSRWNTSNGGVFGTNVANWLAADIEGSSPVPEPATLALMGLGLAGLGFRKHRNKKAA